MCLYEKTRFIGLYGWDAASAYVKALVRNVWAGWPEVGVKENAGTYMVQ